MQFSTQKENLRSASLKWITLRSTTSTLLAQVWEQWKEENPNVYIANIIFINNMAKRLQNITFMNVKGTDTATYMAALNTVRTNNPTWVVEENTYIAPYESVLRMWDSGQTTVQNSSNSMTIFYYTNVEKIK